MKQIALLIFLAFVALKLTGQEAIHSLQYDGVDEHTSLGNPTNLQLTNYTIEVWFYGDNNTKSILTRGISRGNNPDRTLDLFGNGTNLIFFVNSPSGPGHFHTVGAYIQNQWNHVAIVKHGALITSYLNGINTGSSTLSFIPSTNVNTWEIGGNTQFYHDGRIDELKIWNTLRTQSQIRDDMHFLLTGNEAGLVAYYNFNNATGSVLTDQTTTKENGTNINMENSDWTTAYNPIGNLTAKNQTNLRAIWEATETDNSLESDGFWMSTGVGLTETNYAIYGHDNAGSEVVSTDLPGSVVERYQQIWYIDEFGAVTSNITFDLSTIRGVSIRAGVGSGYRLLFRPGTSGAFVDLGPASSVDNTDEVTFSGVALTDGYYTIGTLNETSSPLPIELMGFNATTLNDNAVLLDWQTASELNNDYFTVERSVDVINWEELSKIDGAGNSSSLLSYSTNDNNPYAATSYYRLKQTDFDGEFSYSQVKSVNMNTLKQTKIEVYPNPTDSKISFNGEGLALEQIRIYNVLGEDITMFTEKISANELKIVIDLSKLNTGIYYMRTKATAHTLTVIYKM